MLPAIDGDINAITENKAYANNNNPIPPSVVHSQFLVGNVLLFSLLSEKTIIQIIPTGIPTKVQKTPPIPIISIKDLKNKTVMLI